MVSSTDDSTTQAARIGLFAGNGRLPELFARAARARGLEVHAVAFEGEVEPGFASEVESLTWVKVGALGAMRRAFVSRGISRAVMAGGIGRVRAMSTRPDLGALQVLARLRSMRDDEILRAVADWFEQGGVAIVAATDFVPSVFAVPGHLAGPPLTPQQARDVALGREVAAQLGRADVGQTVVVKEGTVLAVEAVEGTDACVRRAGRLGGPGAVIVKRSKPGQDHRFDLPAAGPVTLEVMREAGATVLAVEAGTTVLLDGALLFKWAGRLGISVVGFS